MNSTKQGKKMLQEVIKIVPKRGEWHERTYANFAQVSKTPFDISIKFCDIPPIEEETKADLAKDGKIEVPIVSEVVLSPNIAEELIKALKTQVSEFKKVQKEVQKKQ